MAEDALESCSQHSRVAPSPYQAGAVGGGGAGGDPTVFILFTEVQAAATAPILIPGLKHSGFDHPLGQGLLQHGRRLCTPTSALTSKSSKKPKVQATDMFPTDWSPPPVEFLTPRAPRASRGSPVHRWLSTAGPQSLRRLACQRSADLEQEPQDADPKGNLASLEELLWNTGIPGQQTATPRGDACTKVSHSHLSLPPLPHQPWATPSWPLLLGHTPQLPATLGPKSACPPIYFHSQLLPRDGLEVVPNLMSPPAGPFKAFVVEVGAMALGKGGPGMGRQGLAA